jgi:oligopeptide transport system ATP-binding protein
LTIESVNDTAGPGLAQPAQGSPVLNVQHLGVQLETLDGPLFPVRDVSLNVHANETVAILGESGSGKSVTSLALMGLLPKDKFSVTAESMTLKDVDLATATEKSWRSIRGSRIAMVFQDPQSSLNPVYTVGSQIAEMFTLHRGASRRDARRAALEMMDKVQIPDAANKFDSYPHEFSGGMRQRIVIAIALSLEPELLIADEPTTALDVTVQAQILDLFKEVARDSNMGTILITHDIAVAATVADRISVMYAGRLVEEGPTRRVLEHPAHPYTQGLLAAVPNAADARAVLIPIKGSPPNLSSIPSGCAFHTRCPLARDECAERKPALREIAQQRSSACFFAEEVMSDAG